MAIKIRYATEVDASSLARINIASFCHQTLWANIFPSDSSTAVLPLKRARCLERMKIAQAHVLVAVDHNHPGQNIIGYAIWTIPDTSIPRPEEIGERQERVVLSEQATGLVHSMAGLMPEGMRHHIYEEVIGQLNKASMGHCQHDDIVLDYLATLPQYQGQGVGTALPHWGIEIAQRLDRRIYLQATADGYSLYRKFGWRTLETLCIDYEQFGGTGEQKFVLMIRESHGENVENKARPLRIAA